MMDFLIRSVSSDASLSPIPFLFGISKDLISMEIFPNVSLVTMEFHMAEIFLSHFFNLELLSLEVVKVI